MKNINPTHTFAWKELQQHYNIMKNIKITDLFMYDKQRFSSFSKIFEDQILLDFSKNHVTKETMNKLLSLAKECFLEKNIKSMFEGKKINNSENQPALHIALRNKNNNPIVLDGQNIMPQINEVLCKMQQFSDSVIEGSWLGCTGKTITDIVNIGIGGSHLGPYMVTEALKFYKNHLKIHFISNIDGTDIVETLKILDPETTIFLISSKTFTTQETITNANSIKTWFLKYMKNTKCIDKHFIAISSNITNAEKFGIKPDNIFKLWNWVSGRYSLWSANGLIILLAIGFNNFKKLLDGAHSMDMHFLHTPLDHNLPIILALIGIWYNNFFNTETEAVLPYDQYMHQFARYLQQLSMESNGKNIDRNGEIITYQTGPIVWGEPGTNGQHSFYQLIHQGTKIIPCDFIAPANSHNMINDHHIKLLANFFAQTKVLAFGNTKKIITQEIKKTQNLIDYIKHVVPYTTCNGNKPTNSILLKSITPYNLGALLALYEHKIFTQGIIFNTNIFDQWGVELGKNCACKILTELKKDDITFSYDSSTNGLINCYKFWKNNN